MNLDLYTSSDSHRLQWSSYFFYILNAVTDVMGPPVKYLILKRLLGSIGKNSIIEHGVFFSGFNNIYLGKDIFIGRKTSLYTSSSRGGEATITVGDHVLIAPHVVITTMAHNYVDLKMPVKCQSVSIEPNVWIGTGAIILPGVVLGEGAVVAAGAVVTSSVIPWKVVAGCPARIIKERKCNKDNNNNG